MKKAHKRVGLVVALLLAVTVFAGCRVTPSLSMGVGVDYYGGRFHARPHANVGFYGHP
ncbi:MAG: hypothetical protein AAF436_02590 [Myxococcota bacterium]